ncbi:MAG: hypothetical protein IIU35_05040, partial [Neisseriaceae bacterium]|nr:hypothetical protein [Neisseriaceae bacterium]
GGRRNAASRRRRASPSAAGLRRRSLAPDCRRSCVSYFCVHFVFMSSRTFRQKIAHKNPRSQELKNKKTFKIEKI